jgi:hypothetical protein
MQNLRVLRVAMLLAAAGAVGACASDEPVTVVKGPGLSVSPSSLTLAPGTQQAATLTVLEGSPARGARFQWRLTDTTVARLDSVGAATTRAYVRALAPGRTVLEFVGGGFTGTIPVLVQ